MHYNQKKLFNMATKIAGKQENQGRQDKKKKVNTDEGQKKNDVISNIIYYIYIH